MNTDTTEEVSRERTSVFPNTGHPTFFIIRLYVEYLSTISYRDY